MKNTWIILGATSGMARAFARQQAEAGDALVLCARNTDEAKALAADCSARGAADVATFPIDIRDATSFDPILEDARTREGVINVAVFVGSMPQQEAIDADPTLIAGTVMDSFSGPAEFLTRIAPQLEARGRGAVVGISSVAGDRGRLGNYVYGAAKAGFTAYLSGLRNRLARSGVHVMTVKPGPVDTPMTWDLGPQPFMSTPEAVAADIAKGLRLGWNTLYTRRIWLLVMMVIRLIPEPIFKRLKI